MTLDPKRIPFSRRGSYLAFSESDGRWSKVGVFLRTLHGFQRSLDRNVFRFIPQSGGKEIPVKVRQTASLLTLTADPRRRMEIVFAGPKIVRVRGKGLGLCLDAPTGDYNYARPAGAGCWEFNLASQNIQFMLRVRSGCGVLDAPWEEKAAVRVGFEIAPDETGGWEIELHEFVAGWKPTPNVRDFDACV
ncbi:MAG: hypothetical protein H7Y43_07295, partial [Akkermansiaceae bacterium]|nr:hypothetical protein [Verrucomicrobiales bacterium]